ncbi:MAG: hypothetical protein KDA80_23770 [Planctomycetaceae bacterium]|nr:hypothetical protein [Planctomycetaceae bacterium]
MSLLSALLDAQQANLTRYSQGSLDAKCSALNNVMHTRCVGKVHQEWKGESAYWKYDFREFDSRTGTLRQSPFENCERLISGRRAYYYYPLSKTLTVSPVGRFSLQHGILDVRPDEAWYCLFPTRAKFTWRELLERGVKSNQRGTVTLRDRGQVAWKTDADNPIQIQTVFDLNQGGNVLTHSRKPFHRPDGKISPGWELSFEWVEDGRGHLRLKKYTGIEYEKSLDDPVTVTEIEILKFDPQPMLASNRFSPKSIQMPQGTRIETWSNELGKSPVLSYHGKAPEPGISASVLNELAEKLKDNGTANPQREQKPK